MKYFAKAKSHLSARLSLLLVLGGLALTFAFSASRLAVAQARREARAGQASRDLSTVQDAGVDTLGAWAIVANYPVAIESTAVGTDGTFAYSAGGFTGITGRSNGF